MVSNKVSLKRSKGMRNEEGGMWKYGKDLSSRVNRKSLRQELLQMFRTEKRTILRTGKTIKGIKEARTCRVLWAVLKFHSEQKAEPLEAFK